MDLLEEYYSALERLKANGSKITKDAVSIEAGRGKGSIKKSRPIFSDLILAINEAAKVPINQKEITDSRVKELEAEVERLNKVIETGWARELSLVVEVYELKELLKKINSDK